MGKITYTIDTRLVKDMTVDEVFNMANKIEAARGSKNDGIDRDLGNAALWVRNDMLQTRFTKEGSQMTIEQYYHARRIVEEDFIQIHRLNYVSFRVVQNVADWLDDKGKLTFSVKQWWKKSESANLQYVQAHRKRTDRASWSTIQDNGRLVYDLIEPFIDPLEVAIRDYLIQKRQLLQACHQKDDITLITKVFLALLFCHATRNTRINFFRNISEKKGVDFAPLFQYANTDAVYRNFVGMAHALGVQFVKDCDGDDVPVGVDIAQSVRVEGAWNRIVDIIINEQLMDETALQAINMNPETKADYERLQAKYEQQRMDEAMQRLKQQDNVKSA